MRLLLASVLFCATLSAYGQRTDSAARQLPPSTNRQPVIPPGIDSPISAPGTLMQSTPNPSAAAEPLNQDGKRKRTAPPSSPRSFGIAIPLGKSKRDTTRNN